MNLMQPKKVKFRKSFRADISGIATSCNLLDKGDYGLKALEPMRLDNHQAESIRRATRRAMSRSAGILWFRFFTDIPQTKKPLEVRMGSGKGPVEKWVTPVKAGRVLLEIAGVTKEVAMHALSMAAYKLPIATKIITREDY